MQNTDHVSNDNAVLWMCRAGHAYHWHCGKSHNTGEDLTEAVGGRKRVLSSEPLARESSFEEKKVKLTPSSFEMDQEDCGSTGSCGRSQGVTEQKADSPYKRNNEPKGSQNTRKPKTSFSATEQHFSMSDSRVQTGEQDVKSKSYKQVEIIISDEEQSEADEDNKGDRISQDNVSEPSAEKLQMHHCQKMALHQPTACQKTAFAPKAKPPLARAYIMQAPVSSSEDRSRNILRLASSTAAGPMAETSGTRSLLGSAAPKVCLKPLPAPSTEAKAQLESQPSAMFFELQTTAAFQQHLQLSPLECGTLGMGSSGDGAENVGEDTETSGSGQTPCSSTFRSPESHSPAASNGGKTVTESGVLCMQGCGGVPLIIFPKYPRRVSSHHCQDLYCSIQVNLLDLGHSCFCLRGLQSSLPKGIGTFVGNALLWGTQRCSWLCPSPNIPL